MSEEPYRKEKLVQMLLIILFFSIVATAVCSQLNYSLPIKIVAGILFVSVVILLCVWSRWSSAKRLHAWATASSLILVDFRGLAFFEDPYGHVATQEGDEYSSFKVAVRTADGVSGEAIVTFHRSFGKEPKVKWLKALD